MPLEYIFRNYDKKDIITKIKKNQKHNFQMKLKQIILKELKKLQKYGI